LEDIMARYWYIGSFREKAPLASSETGGGVYVLDVEAGEVADPWGIDTLTTDVSWMVPHPDGHTMYVVTRTHDDGGTVSVCPIDPATRQFRAAVTLDGGGASPCHAALSPNGRVLLVANYSAGTVASFRLGTDGRALEAAQVVHHQGSGPDPERQATGHPHMIAIDPVTGHVLVPDLGADRVVAYVVDEDTGRLTEAADATVVMPPGSGPRHIAFFADGGAVVAGELDSTATLLRREGEALKVAASVRTFGDPAPGEPSYPSAIRTSGDLVYVANRGPDTVATLRRDGEGLALVGTESCGGRWPRDLVVDEEQRRLLVANQFGSTVTVMPLDDSGAPGAPTGIWSVPNPGSIVPLAGSGAR
jgi:6-phosphogluconolactonase